MPNFKQDMEWTSKGVPTTAQIVSDYNMFTPDYYEIFDDYCDFDGNDYRVTIFTERGELIVGIEDLTHNQHNSGKVTINELENEGIGAILNSFIYYSYDMDFVDESVDSRQLDEWFNPNDAVSALDTTYETVAKLAQTAEQADDFYHSKPLRALANQIKDVQRKMK